MSSWRHTGCSHLAWLSPRGLCVSHPLGSAHFPFCSGCESEKLTRAIQSLPYLCFPSLLHPHTVLSRCPVLPALFYDLVSPHTPSTPNNVTWRPSHARPDRSTSFSFNGYIIFLWMYVTLFSNSFFFIYLFSSFVRLVSTFNYHTSYLM